jgi:hypothetical protein
MADDTFRDNLEKTFGLAVICLDKDFDPAQPGVECVPIDGKCHSIRAVCELVGRYDDALPEPVANLLFPQMRAQHQELRFKLARTATYAVAAQCLLKLMDDRIEDYKRREESRQQRGT